MSNNHPSLALPFESGFIPVFYERLADYRVLTQDANVKGDIACQPKVAKGRMLESADAVISHTIGTYADLVNAICANGIRASSAAGSTTSPIR